MQSILIIAATENELKTLRDINKKNLKIDYFVNGIGPDVNISGLQKLLEKKYDLIINAGICGSLLNNQKKIGEILIPQKVYWSEDNNGRSLKINIVDYIRENYKAYLGSLVTVSEPVDNKIKRRQLTNHFPEAEAVDMELFYFVNLLQGKEVQFISLKTISDLCYDVELKKIMQNTDRLMQPIRKLIKKIVEYI